MDQLKKMKQIFRHQTEMALANLDHAQPDVRIVNFYYDEKTNKIYFTTFKDNRKVSALRNNGTVAITTLPNHFNDANIRIYDAQAKESKKTLDWVAQELINKKPDFEEIYHYGKNQLLVFEISFNEVHVIIDHQTNFYLQFNEQASS